MGCVLSVEGGEELGVDWDGGNNPGMKRLNMNRLFFASVFFWLALFVFACSSDGADTRTPPASTEAPTDTETPSAVTEKPTGTVAAAETETSRETEAFISVAPVPFDGPTSLEERIIASPVITQVRLGSVSSAAESGTTYQGIKYIALLEFSFSVQEYVKGSGAEDLVAVWAGPLFDTQQEAKDALSAIAAARDARWDSRKAIVFLQHSVTYLTSTQRAERFFLSVEILFNGLPDDYYIISSRHNKLWLLSDVAVDAPSQPILTVVPPAEGTAPTITLGEIKTRIAAVTAKLASGDGPEEYMECVQRTYRREGDDHYSIQTGGDGYFYRTPDQVLDSGLPASSIVYELLALCALPDRRDEVWLDGGDVDLFRVELSDGVAHDYSGDGINDSIQYTHQVVTIRPLPGGVYRTHYNSRHVDFVPCNGCAPRHEWAVTVNAPAGTLHEGFFDPVTIGTEVSADATNGVLKPTQFTLGQTFTQISSLKWGKTTRWC